VSWRWVMFVNVPIGLAILLLGRSVIRETEPRHGRFDLIGAVTSTLGMTAIVFALVEAGADGWTGPLTLGSFALGATMLGLFIRTETSAEEPILPLRLFASPTRTTANVSRGLVYAGMYGMFFFLSQYLQDVQGYSPLTAGLAFLPIPMAVFLSSQLTSRVLVDRVPAKVLMLAGSGLATASLVLATQLRPSTSYGQVAILLVLLGIGSGVSFVSLTSASLSQVAEEDAGAASGLINVSQQLGAALGLAVLVTAFGVLTHHQQLGARAADVAQAHAVLVHGLDQVLGIGALFTLAAFVLVSVFIPQAPRVEPTAVVEPLPLLASVEDEPWIEARRTEAG
jgi:MFS family permease